MNLKESLALAAGLMLMASAALAETKSSGSGSFSDLSPGNQNIARTRKPRHPMVRSRSASTKLLRSRAAMRDGARCSSK